MLALQARPTLPGLSDASQVDVLTPEEVPSDESPAASPSWRASLSQGITNAIPAALSWRRWRTSAAAAMGDQAPAASLPGEIHSAHHLMSTAFRLFALFNSAARKVTGRHDLCCAHCRLRLQTIWHAGLARPTHCSSSQSSFDALVGAGMQRTVLLWKCCKPVRCSFELARSPSMLCEPQPIRSM